MGVTRVGNKYRVRYTTRGVRHNVGVYKTEQEAHDALADALWLDPTYPDLRLPPKSKAEYNPKRSIIKRITNVFNRFRTSTSAEK